MAAVRYLAVTGVTIAFFGCGEDSKPDLDEVTRELARQVAEQTGTRDVRVVCADDVDEGDVCDVTAGGGVQAQIKVTRLEDGDVEGEIVQP